jgi:hypothetical protein
MGQWYQSLDATCDSENVFQNVFNFCLCVTMTIKNNLQRFSKVTDHFPCPAR